MMMATLFYDDENNTLMVESLLKLGADPHIQSTIGESAVHYAAHLGLNDILQLFNSEGVDMNRLTTPHPHPDDLFDQCAKTCLHFAIRFDRESTTRELLKMASLNVFTPDSEGNTALHYCAMYQSKRAYTPLLHHLVSKHTKMADRVERLRNMGEVEVETESELSIDGGSSVWSDSTEALPDLSESRPQEPEVDVESELEQLTQEQEDF